MCPPYGGFRAVASPETSEMHGPGGSGRPTAGRITPRRIFDNGIKTPRDPLRTFNSSHGRRIQSPMSTLLATADDLARAVDGTLPETVPVNTMWVVVAAILVLFMQAGFAGLEMGFSRTKNAGTVIAKIMTNLSIAAICYWAVGFAFAFGSADVLGISSSIIGSNGFFLQYSGNGSEAFPVMGLSDATVDSKFLFQFAFCAVSLAIVWGTTLERIKYSAYVIYAIVFSALIYPIGSHWVFGGGWLQNGDTPLLPTGMQDFAGSTAVHLIGATGALAALLLLGARKGKYGADGKPRAIPGHSMPLVGFGVLILFIGWFGFNPGSTLGIGDVRMGDVAVVTLHGRRGRCDRCVRRDSVHAAHDRHRHGGQRHDRRARGHHRAVRLRRGLGGADHRLRRRPDRGLRRHLDRQEDRRPGRRAVGARPGGHLGNDRLRHLHGAAARPVQRLRRSRRRARLLGPVHAADRTGGRRAGGLHLRVRAQLPDLRRDQGDDRAACERRGGGGRPRHHRARHVRLSRGVHPAVRDRRRGTISSAGSAAGQPVTASVRTKEATA